MRVYIIILTLILFGCQVEIKEKENKKLSTSNIEIRDKSEEKHLIKEDQNFIDSLYNRESENYISKLEEIPNRESNAYKLTIISKNKKSVITKILNARPGMSKIDYCTDLYTVVSFSCGGPCYSQVYVFTNPKRNNEQFDYGQSIINNSKLIAHIKDEEFENLIIHNLMNNKELIIDISDNNWQNYGQMDSLIFKNDNLKLFYQSHEEKQLKKTINLKSIL